MQTPNKSDCVTSSLICKPLTITHDPDHPLYLHFKPSLLDIDNGVKVKASSGQSNPIKASRTHNELHKELLLAHKRGLALSSRSELQQALERRMRVQSDREEEGQNRTPLEDVLLRRQQKQLEGEKEQKEKVQEEAQLMEFVRVRQNLRKIHSAMQSKAANT